MSQEYSQEEIDEQKGDTRKAEKQYTFSKAYLYLTLLLPLAVYYDEYFQDSDTLKYFEAKTGFEFKLIEVALDILSVALVSTASANVGAKRNHRKEERADLKEMLEAPAGK